MDFEYFFTPNWSTELVLTYPQTQTVTVSGTSIGTFKHLPPVLTAKYDFLPKEGFQPYVGVGVNFTIISDVNLAVPDVSPLKLNSTSIGPALQAGFDYKLQDHWYLNADVKWFKLGSDVDLPDGTKSRPCTSIRSCSASASVIGLAGIRARLPMPMAAPAPAPVAAPPPSPPVDSTAAPPPPPVARPGSAETQRRSRAPRRELRDGVGKTDAGLVEDSRRGRRDAEAARPTRKRRSTAIRTRSARRTTIIKLSQRRAESVVAYLVAHGIDASLLSAKGFGAENPVEDNKTASGRAANRRVTIQFTERVPK